MRVLVVHNHYRQPGGEDSVVAAETRLLEERGHGVIRYIAHNNEVLDSGPLTAAVKAVWNAASYRDVRRVLKECRPDVMHVHNTWPMLSPSIYYAAAAERVPVVQTIHNYRLVCPSGDMFRDGRSCRLCLGRRVALPGIVYGCYRGSRAASAVSAVTTSVHRALGTWQHRIQLFLAPSSSVRETLIQGGVPPHAILVKPHFVDPDPGVGTGDGGYAVFAGRLGEVKGLRLLLDAWNRLLAPVPLKVVGDGPLLGEVLDAARRLPIDSVGWVPAEDVLALFARARWVVVPSLSSETFGLVVIEAFAVGVPVIASDGPFRDLIRHGENGLLFHTGDAQDLAATVEWAIRHPLEMREIGRRGRKTFEAHYTADANYGALVDAYRFAAKRMPEQTPPPLPVAAPDAPVGDGGPSCVP